MSPVVLVSNLPRMSDVDVEILYNVFSCFGNIKAVLYLVNKGKCFLQFTHELFAHSCLTLANGTFFAGEKLKVSFSNRKKLDLQTKRNKESKRFNQVKRVNPLERRYKNFQSAIIASPSDSLLVIGLPRDPDQDVLHRSVFSVMRGLAFQPRQIMIVAGMKRQVLAEEFRRRGKLASLERAVFSIYRYNNESEAMKIVSQAHRLEGEGFVLDVSYSYFRC